jgi:hypothetical protein
MAIEGQVQYLRVLVRLVPTRKPVNQHLLSPQLTGMRAPTLARLLPAKAGHLSSRSYTSTPSRSILSPPPHNNTTDSRPESPYTSSETPTYSNTHTPTSYSFTNTSTATQGTSLRRPQTSQRSPLSSVRNIVAAWKSRSLSTNYRKYQLQTRHQRRDFLAYGTTPRELQ